MLCLVKESRPGHVVPVCSEDRRKVLVGLLPERLTPGPLSTGIPVIIHIIKKQENPSFSLVVGIYIRKS